MDFAWRVKAILGGPEDLVSRLNTRVMGLREQLRGTLSEITKSAAHSSKACATTRNEARKAGQRAFPAETPGQTPRSVEFSDSTSLRLA